jgi:hypothetical protein
LAFGFWALVLLFVRLYAIDDLGFDIGLSPTKTKDQKPKTIQ